MGLKATSVGFAEGGSVHIMELSFDPPSYWELLKQGSNSSEFNIRSF